MKPLQTPLAKFTASLRKQGRNYVEISDRTRDTVIVQTFLEPKRLQWRFTYRGQLPPKDPIL